jgi:hypothetical protein
MAQLKCTQIDLDQLRLNLGEFGFCSLPNAIAPSVLAGLLEEAQEQRKAAQLASKSAEVSYRAKVASLGPESKKFLFGQQTIELLASLLGENVSPTETHSCLTFYETGDHLGPHLDQPMTDCRATVIVYLAAYSPSPRSPSTGLVLHVYGREMTSGRTPILTIPTETGAIVIGRGSKFWHERPNLKEGEHVIALTACYSHAPN